MSSTIKSLFSAIKTLAIVGEATAEEISYAAPAPAPAPDAVVEKERELFQSAIRAQALWLHNSGDIPADDNPDFRVKYPDISIQGQVWSSENCSEKKKCLSGQGQARTGLVSGGRLQIR